MVHRIIFLLISLCGIWAKSISPDKLYEIDINNTPADILSTELHHFTFRFGNRLEGDTRQQQIISSSPDNGSFKNTTLVIGQNEVENVLVTYVEINVNQVSRKLFI